MLLNIPLYLMQEKSILDSKLTGMTSLECLSLGIKMTLNKNVYL